VDTEKFARLISQRSGAKEGDILGILRTGADVMHDCLLDGDAVKWDRVGVWSAGITSDGVATPEELRRVKKKKSVNFRSATELREKIELADDLYTEEVTDLQPSS
jgi:predicted histone-like DNA-binding protein